MALSDEELFNRALAYPLGDYCRVHDPDGGACDLYVSGSPVEGSSYTGIPLNTNDQGTGCVANGGSCYYQGAEYDLSEEERDAMCTTSAVANAAAQLRYGIRNGRCMDNASYYTPCETASNDWDIIYNDDLVADFSTGSAHELQFSYDITVLRSYEYFVFESDCETPITDVMVAITDISRTPKDADASLDTLILAVDVDKANIAGSSIWNPATNELQICVAVQLVLEDPYWIVKEDKRVLTIDFDLSADFNITNNLGAGSIEEGAGSTNVDDYVMACKCGGPDDFVCDSSPLPLNDELHVCVYSVEPEVEIETITSMVSAHEAAVVHSLGLRSHT